MSKIKFYTAYDGSPIVPEVNNDPSEVMLAGFEPDDLRIKELLLAGERLEAFKFGYVESKADYDFDADDDVPDNYDSVDDYMDELEAQEMYNQTMQRIQTSYDERENMFSRRLREEKSSSPEPAEPVQEETKEGA